MSGFLIGKTEEVYLVLVFRHPSGGVIEARTGAALAVKPDRCQSVEVPLPEIGVVVFKRARTGASTPSNRFEAEVVVTDERSGAVMLALFALKTQGWSLS
ncbi:hypothetical protein IHN63_00060 [Deinococcus sp. 6YEL10]|uniref:hypothetical protein n=1 Tax=Deinococcus sp. 6YEL10 TaxID=2745870 RepID=UPI001E3AEC70|nr:hypothetical protein [Deinococcus sp. 6YEL10]MCD0159691.1 hypothetical protein [Deinococcus sp. 6YEL10]